MRILVAYTHPHPRSFAHAVLQRSQIGALAVVLLAALACSGEPPPPVSADVPCPAPFIDRLLQVIERDIVPLTREGTKEGNKVFGAAILRKSDLSLVVAGTNTEIENPLWHGEVTTINQLYALPPPKRIPPGDAIFLTTHEPCPLCLSAITWAGFDNFYYLFSYEDSRDSFAIPHDLRILHEVFNPEGYTRKNAFWTGYSVMDLIRSCEPEPRAAFLARVDALKETYAELSENYQKNKGDSDIPLK